MPPTIVEQQITDEMEATYSIRQKNPREADAIFRPTEKLQ